MMPSRLSQDQLSSLEPILGSLARLVKSLPQLGESGIRTILLGAGLDPDPAVLAELKLWGQLLIALKSNADNEQRQSTVEALRLRGLNEAPALLAVQTVAAAVQNASSLPASDKSLAVRPETIDFGTLPPGQPAWMELEVQGEAGQVLVESDQLQVSPLIFGAGTTRLRVEVKPLEAGLLWALIKLVTPGANLEVPVLARWEDPSESIGASMTIPPGSQLSTTAVPTPIAIDAPPRPTSRPVNSQISLRPTLSSATRSPAKPREPQPPPLLVVAADGSGQFIELEEAFSKATAGAIIHIKAGNYIMERVLLIDRALTITGEGVEQVRIQIRLQKEAKLGESSSVAFAFRCNGSYPFTLSDIAFEQLDARDGFLAAVNGPVLCSRCRFTRSSQTSLDGVGLVFFARSRGTLDDCEVAANGMSGVAVYDEAKVDLTGSNCHHNGTGITFRGNSSGSIKETRCHHNRRYGIAVWEQAKPILEGNLCTDNGDYGIIMPSSLAGKLKNNAVPNNGKAGIGSTDGAGPG